MFRHKAKKIFWLTGFYSLVVAFGCHALPEDNKQVLEISAGSADLNQQTHRGVYLDGVELTQGTTHVQAHEAITEGNEKNRLTIAIAKGKANKQAHYWTQTALDKPLLHAFADTITWYAEKRLIVLAGNARVEQGDNSFSAPEIRYDTEHQHIISKSDGKARTTIVIHPEKRL